MSGEEHKQRLAAILAADVAGYSRLMSVDERATVAALDAARAVFRAQIESNQGRVIDMAGDSVLALFDTAKGAVGAALAVQKSLTETSGAVPEDRRMRFRVGVHLGDVIEKGDGTIYGDGVNIAARLERLAAPGGITVSDSVRNAVHGKVSAAFEDQGEQTVKNIAEPVHAFRVVITSVADSKPGATVGAIDLSLPDKPSIAVLPFTNMSGDPGQEYFADGVTEDIITELSRFKSLFVIARNSTFSYKGKSPDIRQVGKELGVRFVLEGSMRKAGNRIRVTGQLIDSLTGNHIWAEKYDRVLEDVFEVQEEITRSIVTSIAPQIEVFEAERARTARPQNLSAYELGLRARAAAHVAFYDADRSARDAAVQFANEALALDPRCSGALRTLAFAQWQRIYFQTAASDTLAREAGIDAAERAIAIDSEDHDAHLRKGMLLFQAGEQDAGLAATRRAHELNPNDTLTLLALAFCEGTSGNPQRGIELSMNALRLSPRDPRRYSVLNTVAWAHFAARDYSNAAEFARRSVSEAPKLPNPRLCLAVSYIGLGETSRARSELDVVRQIAPEMVDARLASRWVFSNPDLVVRSTTFLRIAAGLEDPGAADALR